MTVDWLSLGLMAMPLAGTTVGLAWRGNLAARKTSLELATLATFILAAWGIVAGPLRGMTGLLAAILCASAFAALCGQPSKDGLEGTWKGTVLWLALGMGYLTSGPPASGIFLLGLLATLGWWLLHGGNPVAFDVRWGVATVCLGALGCLGALVLDGRVSSAASLVAFAVFLPLVPFHSAYAAALTSLNGSLPAFAAVLFPIVGFHGVLSTVPTIAARVEAMASWLALAGIVVCALKALAKRRAESVIAYGSVVSFGILWWCLASGRAQVGPALAHAAGVALAASGLLLAFGVVRARFGEIGLGSLGGLAEPMPRFAVLLSLLSLAAMGLPPFAVYSGLVGMMLSPGFTWSVAAVVLIFGWLAATWYVFDMTQGVLFRRPPPSARFQDLDRAEFASLFIVVALLLLLGVMPSGDVIGQAV